MRPIQFIETNLSFHNPTLSRTGKGWNVKEHFNWFDKTVDITKLKGKPPPMFGCNIKNLREAQESFWINKSRCLTSTRWIRIGMAKWSGANF
jgi:hypothetical protein